MPLERVSKGFKDISMTFQRNPLNGDLIAIKNETCIARSIKNIIFTSPGEKFFDESFGSDVKRSLFESLDDLTASTIESQIRESIRNYEPRVILRSVRAVPDYDSNAFDVILIYDIIGEEVPTQQLQFVLQQTR